MTWCRQGTFRHRERRLDLAFVRDPIRETSAGIGRPSIDPVVFFKRQLILFFEGLRSERRLIERVRLRKRRHKRNRDRDDVEAGTSPFIRYNYDIITMEF